MDGRIRGLIAIALALALPNSSLGQAVDQKLLVCDPIARHNPDFPETGTIFLQSVNGLAGSIYLDAAPLRVPYCVEVDPDGRVLVSDRGADLPGVGGAGAVFRFHPFTRELELAAGSDEFVALCDLDVAPDGRILVVDRDANPLHHAQPDAGAVFAIDPVSGGVSVFSSPPEFIDPYGVVVDSTGAVFVIDENANPLGHPGDSGCIWQIDATDGSIVRMVASPTFFSTPLDAVAWNGSLYLVDATAEVTQSVGDSLETRNSGTVFRVNTATGAAEEFFSFTPFFASLCDIERVDQKLYLIDKDIDFGSGGFQGGLYDIDFSDPDNIRPRRLMSSDDWGDPRSIALLPLARIGIPRHELTDVNGPPLNPGDAIEVDVRLENLVTFESGFAFSDSLPEFFDLDAGSISATTGTITILPTNPPIIQWLGSIDSDATTSLHFEGVVGDIERLRQPMPNSLLVRDEGGGALVSVVADTAYRSLHDDEVVITDPVSFFTNGQLAVVRGDGQTAEVVISTDEHTLENPNGIVVDANGIVYFVDPVASVPPDTTRKGAVFRYTPDRGRVDVFAVNSMWEDPTSLALDADGRLYVLDTGVTLPGGGRGAIFRLDPVSGVVREIITDPRWELPVSIASTSDGDLLVVDRVSHIGGHPGAIFRVTADRDFSVDATSGLFRAPVGIATLGNSEYYVADYDANSVFRVRNGTVTTFAHSDEFDNPWGLTIARTGELLLSDPGNSSVFKIDIDTGRVDLFINIPDLSAPQGIATLLAPRFEDSLVLSYDQNGGSVVPGDDMVFIVQVRNTGTLHDPACSVITDVPPYLTVDESSVAASSGTVDFVDRQVQWHGPVDVGSLVNIIYEGQISPAVGAGTRLINEATVDPSVGITHVFRDTVVVSGSFRPGDLLVLDSDATPPGSGGRGTLFRRDVTTSEAEPVVGGTPFVFPVAIGIDDERRALILDQSADPLGIGGNRGALFRYDALLQEMTVAVTSLSFRRPSDFLVGRTPHTFYVLDRDANPYGLTGLPGAVFDVNETTQAVHTVASDARFVNPTAFTYDTDGTLLVADPSALAVGGSTGRGVLFRVDPATGTVTPLVTGDDWVELTDVVVHPSGDYLVSDISADPRGYGGDAGAVFRISKDDLSVSVFVAPLALRNPSGLSLTGDGKVLILDRGYASSPSKVWWVNEEVGGDLQLYWNPTGLVRPEDVLFLDPPNLAHSNFSVTDANGPPVAPGDRLNYRLTVRNDSSVSCPLLIELGLSDLATVVPGSIGVGEGTATYSRGTIHVATTAPSGDSTSVSFSVDLDAPLDAGTGIPTVAVVDAGNDLVSTIVDQQRIPLEFRPNDLVVLDRLGESGEVEQGSGTIFKWDAAGAAVQPLSSLNAYERLESMTLDPLDDTYSFVVDSEADPDGTGDNPGAVFRIRTRDGRLDRVYTSPEFVSPTGVFFERNGDLVVADINANPEGTGSTTGTLFRVHRDTGVVEPIVTHPYFQQPRHGVVLDDGTYLVVDRGANPRGLPGNVGTLFHVFPETGVVLVEKTGGWLVDPVWIAPYVDGSYLIVDEASDPAALGGTTGAVLKYDAVDKILLPLASSRLFVVPAAAKAGSQGEIFVADRLMDPNGSAPGRGAILRWDPNDASTRVYAFSPSFRSPIGVEFLESPTPVQALEVGAREVGAGHVRVEWTAIVSGRVVRADVYRSLDTPGKESPEPQDLLTPEGLAADASSFDDLGVPTRGVATYWIALTEEDERRTLSRPFELSLRGGAPRAYALHASRPNPFTSTTSFAFDVPAPGGRVQIGIYDIAGRLVRELRDEGFQPGVYRMTWDGKNEDALAVAPGVYFYRMKAAGFADTRRVVLLH